LGPTQLAEVLREIPRTAHPDLLVGYETKDDAGVFRVSDDLALVQTMDFFTPIVDDPYAYGSIAAANAFSDIYAMGGKPLTVMNIACFDPSQAPPEVWGAVFRGIADKCSEAGAVIVGGHTVEDSQPKFGLSVTGVVNPNHMLRNVGAKPGDYVYLSKPIGTGIVTTAHKFDDPIVYESLDSSEFIPAPPGIEEKGKVCALDVAIAWMALLNKKASKVAIQAEALCATDITGFGLAGHLFHVAEASKVRIELDSESIPLLPRLKALVENKNITAGSRKNRQYLGDALKFSNDVPLWLHEAIIDPQTSGGLAIFSKKEIPQYRKIGRVVEGTPAIVVL